jgi:hypothetical protein
MKIAPEPLKTERLRGIVDLLIFSLQNSPYVSKTCGGRYGDFVDR